MFVLNPEIKCLKEPKTNPLYDYYKTEGEILKYIDKYKKILLFGAANGNLYKDLKFAQNIVCGVEFNEEMVNMIDNKSNSIFLVNNMLENASVTQEKFDHIIIHHVFHYLSAEEKNKLLINVYSNLKDNGSIIISGVIFANKAHLIETRRKYLDIWDEDFDYLVIDKMVEELSIKKYDFTKLTPLSSVFVIYK